MDRLDRDLVRRAFFPSREKAKAAICAGMVLVNGQEERRPSCVVEEHDVLSLREGAGISYVGRGSFKLLKALDFFELEVAGLRCLDVGASTGGFTQVLLERGALQVYSIDVGSGQLARLLKEDPRVVSMEQTDFRTLSRERVGAVEFACVDVSFISLRLILPNLYSLLNEGSSAVCLLKPQFEAGPRRAKKGIVKDIRIHDQVMEEIILAIQGNGFKYCGATHSPICGGDGNIEYLLHIFKGISSDEIVPQPAEVVRKAWKDLNR